MSMKPRNDTMQKINCCYMDPLKLKASWCHTIIIKWIFKHENEVFVWSKPLAIHMRDYHVDTYEQDSECTWARMIGPPWDAKSFSSFIKFTILARNIFISFCKNVPVSRHFKSDIFPLQNERNLHVEVQEQKKSVNIILMLSIKSKTAVMLMCTLKRLFVVRNWIPGIKCNQSGNPLPKKINKEACLVAIILTPVIS